MNIGKDTLHLSGVRMIPLLDASELQTGRLLTGPAWQQVWLIEAVRRSQVNIKSLTSDPLTGVTKTIAFSALLPKANWPSTPRVWVLVPAGEVVRVRLEGNEVWVTPENELQSGATLPILPRIKKAWQMPAALVALRTELRSTQVNEVVQQTVGTRLHQAAAAELRQGQAR